MGVAPLAPRAGPHGPTLPALRASLRGGRGAGTDWLRVEPFCPAEADAVASWLTDPLDALWAAPRTPMPISGADVESWAQRALSPLVARREPNGPLLAYGEVNAFDPPSEEAWLGHVIVNSTARGQRVGQAFCRALVWHALRQLGKSAVSLVVFPENTGAIQCYRRAGFTITGEETKRFELAGELRDQRLLRMAYAGWTAWLGVQEIRQARDDG